MPQTIRLTVTPDLQKALEVLRQSTLGTLNTTELIKMAVGGYAQIKIASNLKNVPNDTNPEDLDSISSQLFYEWSQEDGSFEVSNIAQPEKLKPFNPKP